MFIYIRLLLYLYKVINNKKKKTHFWIRLEWILCFNFWINTHRDIFGGTCLNNLIFVPIKADLYLYVEIYASRNAYTCFELTYTNASHLGVAHKWYFVIKKNEEKKQENKVSLTQTRILRIWPWHWIFIHIFTQFLLLLLGLYGF